MMCASGRKGCSENDQAPMTNKIPMTNAQAKKPLVIGHWAFIGH
jgi:hypothetical protein